MKRAKRGPMGIYRTSVAVLVALVGLATGGALMERAAAAQETEAFDRAQLRRVTEIIGQRYVEQIPSDRLYRMAIDGMLEELGDPHSRFVDADSSTELDITMTGNYGGLGIRVQQVNGWVTVMSVIPGTPAEREGMLTGDRIVGVDGQSVAGWDEAKVIDRLRGPVGDAVKVRVARLGLSEPIELTVTRDSIHVPPVLAYELDEHTGVVQLTQFSREARAELEASIDSLVDRGADHLVLDLRGNPGGLLEEGVAVAGLFLPRNAAVVSTASRLEEQNEVFRNEDDPAFPDLPMTVLIDGASASASEIVAGALQDHDRALIVGTPSFGKGSMQTVYLLPGGNHLSLTTAHWYTPSGRSIQREHEGGVAEEQVVSADPAAIDGEQTDAPDVTSREVFHTDGGRPVYGGGGIVPDEIVRDTLTDAERRLGAELKREALSIRQLAFRFAMEWAGDHPDIPRDFSVTPAMRTRFRDMLRAENVQVDDATWAAVTPLVDRYLAVQIANKAFGELEAYERSNVGNEAFETAVQRLRAAGSMDELMKEASGPTP